LPAVQAEPLRALARAEPLLALALLQAER